MKKKVKDIQTIYDWAVDALNGNHSVSDYDIIHKCADVIEDVPELEDLWRDLAFHINMWNCDTLEEMCEQAEVLIEEITGCLGEWLDKQ